ncbi:hypothetical protein [Cutibacterium sp.]|uniref:hypothetical protein n=1 Tax=Cutibacterium sp. TaxID=1912221 RepID=UPI0026DD4935|nr:hypothetical protein [Cutibacterium sp.]MDO4413284.1 hypothetical protein [Cutibacterium sp.]
MGTQRRRLIFKMALHHPGGALGTVVLALVLVAACTLVSGFVSAYGIAVERGAQSGFGSYSQQVTGNEDVSTYMRELQEKGKAVAIAHSRQNVIASGHDRAASADVTMTSGPAGLGVVVTGRHPNKPAEVTVSAALARQLEAQLGDNLDLVDVDSMGEKSPFTLVGVTENPASINEVSASAISHDEVFLASAEVWLTNNNLAKIDNVLKHGGGQTSTVNSVVKRASDNAASYQAISPQLSWLFGGLLIAAMIAAIYAADRQRRREVYRVLIALGDQPIRASMTTCAQTMLLALCGGLIGWMLAVVLLPGLSAHLATFFQQRWTEVTWTTVNIAALVTLAMIMAGGILAAGFTVMSEKRRARTHRMGFSRPVLMGVGIIGIVVTILLVISRQLFIFPEGHRVAMIVGALTIPALAYSITLMTRRHRVIALLGNRLQKVALAALAVVFALNYWGALYASGVADLTNWLSGQINGENSYLEVSNANEQAIKNLLERFPELKPHTAIFGDASTSEQMLRITDNSGSECFKAAKLVDACPQSNLDMVYIASGGLVDRNYTGHASASYVSKDGKVTVVGIGIADSTVKQVTEIGGISGDKNLDNNVLRGLILPADSPLLKQFGVSKPQSYTAIITGFAALPDNVRDGVRSTVLSQAPFAAVSDSDDPEMRQLRAQAVARQLFAIIASGTLMLAIVSTLISDQRIERRLIALGGGNQVIRVKLLAPFLFAYTITVASSVILGRLATMDRIPFTQLDTAVVHDYGVVWALGLTELLFIVPAVILAARSTAVSQDRT